MNTKIAQVQTNLNTKGFTLKVDGIFGPKTRAAIASFIGTICTKYGVDSTLLVAIATCESGLNPFATLWNPPSKSTDRGLFQWNDKYHSEITDAQAFDIEQATILAAKAVKNGKAHEYWSASQPCWSKKVSPDILKKYGIV